MEEGLEVSIVDCLLELLRVSEIKEAERLNMIDLPLSAEVVPSHARLELLGEVSHQLGNGAAQVIYGGATFDMADNGLTEASTESALQPVSRIFGIAGATILILPGVVGFLVRFATSEFLTGNLSLVSGPIASYCLPTGGSLTEFYLTKGLTLVAHLGAGVPFREVSMAAGLAREVIGQALRFSVVLSGREITQAGRRAALFQVACG